MQIFREGGSCKVNNDFKILLGTVIDNSSLTDAQKKIAKEHFAADLSLNLDLNEFAKQKKNIKEQTKKLTEELKTAFKNAKFSVDDKELETYAKDFLHRIQQATKEQERLNKLQEKHNLAEQEKYYGRIADNLREIYSLKEKLLTANKQETKEIENQIRSLNSSKAANYGQINKKGLYNKDWQHNIDSLEGDLKDNYKNVVQQDELLRQSIQYYEDEKRYQEIRKKAQTQNKADQEAINQTLKEYNQLFDEAEKQEKEKRKERQARIKEEQEYQTLREKYKAEGREQELNEEAFVYYKKEEDYLQERNKYLAEGKAQQDAYNETVAEYTRLFDESNAINDEELLRQSMEYYEQEKYYQEERAKALAEGKAQEDAYNAEIKETTEYYKQMAKEADSAYEARRKLTEKANKIQLSTDITKIENDYKRFGIVSQEVENNLKELKIARENALKAEGTDRASAEIEKYNQKLAETKSSWKELQATQVSVNQRTSQMTEMQEWMRKNKNATKLCGDQVQKLIQECQTCDKVRFDQIKNEFKELQVEAGKAGKLGNTFFGGIIEEGKKFLQWTSVTGVIMSFSDEIRHAVGELKDLDSILTEISKTSDLTEKQLKRLGETSLDSASKYGKKASELLTGVQEMYRAGFNNAEEMAELSLLAQSAGDMEATASNDYLLATNAAYDFKGSVEQLTDVLNRQNFITNNAAVSMQDMADATSQAASIAAQYGVEVDELSALIGVAVSKTRESGAEVGTALKALLINLQDTTSKPIREAFDAVGISMTKLVNGSEQLKTPVELLKELASAYNSLPEGDVKRANILNDIGGKHHANTLSAVLSSMDSLNEMLDLYHSNLADGSAYKEAMKSANNWEGSLNRLSNSFTDLVQNFADSDAIIGTINLINGLIKGIDTLSESVGVFGTIGIGTLGFLGAKGHGLTNYVTIS